MFDNFKLEENLNPGELIYVKDYHNLGLAITNTKKIYTGFPPNLNSSFSDSITKYTNGITINNNFIFITCLSDHIIYKLNLKTGKISIPTMATYSTAISKSCPITIIGNSAYILISSQEENKIKMTIFNMIFLV